MGDTAENVARKYEVSRPDQELLALQSHQKAAAARAAGLLKDEIIPITDNNGDVIAEDGCIRPGTTLEALASLKPVFDPEHGVVTAGTSSPLTDGASAVLVTSEEFARKHGLQPSARIVAMAAVGCDPALMGIGPIPATQKALRLAGLQAEDLDVAEINEAFASQALACVRELGIRPEVLNIDGGGMAIGHPLGATGARITGKAAALLKRTGGRYALAAQCIGGGQGIATILEKI
jgi:acetyl-CoA acyltransferase